MFTPILALIITVILVQVARRFDAVHPGHADVEQYDVRILASRDFEGLQPVACLADHLVNARIIEQLPQAIARRRFVVDNQDPHCSDSSSGNFRRTE